jgi:hypothetical protein
MTIYSLHIPPATADPVVPALPTRPALSALSPEAFPALADHIDERDRPILAMLMAGDHPDAIAARMGISARALRLRRQALTARLAPTLSIQASAPQAAERRVFPSDASPPDRTAPVLGSIRTPPCSARS